MVRADLPSGLGQDLPRKGLEVSAHSQALWNPFLGLYLRRGGAGGGNRTVLQTAGLRGGAGLRHDGNRIARQPEPPVPRGGRLGGKDPAGARMQAGRRRRNPGARRKRFGGLLGKRATARSLGPRMAADGRSRRARRRRQPEIPRTQEKRDRHGGGAERLSRGSGTGA